MGNAPAAAPEKEQVIPESWPRDQLFVAVCDNAQEYAGEDGGPQSGGKGRWRVGEVGVWTSKRKLPLAHRNPEDGLIWKGWLEPVVRTRRNPQDQMVCEESQKFFSVPLAQDQRAAESAKKRGMMAPKSRKPTSKAAARAALGAPQMADALKPLSERQAQAAQVGVPIDDGR